MTSTQLYLPTVLPQWGIFAGVVLITIGYVDKKNIWTYFGWIALTLTSLTALYFNLCGDLNALALESDKASPASVLISTGWQTAAGGILAIASLIMFHFKSKRYPLLAVLTLLYFIITCFLYLQVTGNSDKKIKTSPETEQKR